MKDETTANVNQIGLYYDKESNRFIGCLEGTQADAAIRAGYVLYKEGREAAMTTQAELDKLSASEKPAPVEAPTADSVPAPTQKGSK